MSEEIEPLKIFVGWDSREDIAYQVCKQSILDTASVPVEIIPLDQRILRKQGIYTRPEDKLASTEFTFTRFLVPHLADYKGWALFIDCDFVFLDDVKKLFDQTNDKYAVMCAQHDYTPKEGTKMDGQQQHIYPRKNWSSMVLYNCEHIANAKLNLDLVNNETLGGAFFHRFSWLEDKHVGKVSHEWNWLVGWYRKNKDGTPKALHYTEGGPWFEEYKDCEFSTEWYLAHKSYLETKVQKLENKLDYEKSKIVEIEHLTLSDDKKEILQDFLNNMIDPDEATYPDSKKKLNEKVKKEMGKKVASIAPSAGDFNYDLKGVNYDPYCQNFILGAGGKISSWDVESKSKNALVIRGLGGTSQKALNHCRETGRDFYAIDTGYMQPGKSKEYHRITKNNLQNLGPIIERPFDRLRKLSWKFRKRKDWGHKILVCPPSEKVMKFYGEDLDKWMEQTLKEIKANTDRPVEVRLKPSRTDRVTTNTIWSALDETWCLVTYNSIAATEAMLYGVPAIALAPNAASVLCNTQIKDIENNLNRPSKDELTAFAAHLSYCQFTPHELRTGYAFRVVNGYE